MHKNVILERAQNPLVVFNNLAIKRIISLWRTDAMARLIFLGFLTFKSHTCVILTLSIYFNDEISEKLINKELTNFVF